MPTPNPNRRRAQRRNAPTLATVRALLAAALLLLFAVAVAAALRDSSGDQATQVLTLLAPLLGLALGYYFHRRG